MDWVSRDRHAGSVERGAHMKTATLKYPSADGKTAIRALLWEPDAAEQPEGSETPERLRYSDVRGIVQVVH